MSWAQDMRYAARTARQQPWFSAAIVLTLAFGIGVNTAVFTLVNAVLYKPLPFPGGERLVTVQSHLTTQGDRGQRMSYPDYREFKAQAKTFSHLEGFAPAALSVGERGNPPERFQGAHITAGIFEMIQVPPVVGRALRASDAKPGAAPVLLLSHGVWKDRYGSDAGVVGRVVRVNEKPATIIGVMPEGFQFPNNEKLWMPVIEGGDWEKRDNRRLMLVGLLQPETTIAAASADLGVIAQRLSREFPDTNKDTGVMVRTFHQTFNGGPIRLVFLLMMGAVGFVLLISCANVANMLLSRAVQRVREISIRTALGASRGRILRQLLTESVLLSLAGGIGGLGLAYWGVEAFSLAVADVGKPYWIDFRMDWMVLLYFLLISVVSGLVFGLAPALHSSKVDLNESLKEGVRSSGSGRSGWLSAGLVVLQFTLAMVLLTGAGLMMHSMLRHMDSHAGVPSSNILTARVDLPASRYEKPEQRLAFADDLRRRLGSLPGVQMATFASAAPGTGAPGWSFEIEGRPPVEERSQRPSTLGVAIAPGHFQLINSGLLRGRDFDETDGLPGKETIIVSKRFAERYWPNQDPIGKRIRLLRSDTRVEPWLTVIGVSPDFQQAGAGQEPTPERETLVYIPFRQEALGNFAVLLRTSGAAAASIPALRSEVQQLDQDLVLFGVEPLRDALQRQRWHLRVFGTAFLVFAIIALLMAAVGIYAVMAHATSRRTREIGVRIAMGATVSEILRVVMRRGVAQLGVGLALGLAASLGVCQLMNTLLFGINSTDLVTLGVVASVLTVSGLLACWIPARRAAALDPVRALRHE